MDKKGEKHLIVFPPFFIIYCVLGNDDYLTS